jgi:hypothetical protein
MFAGGGEEINYNKMNRKTKRINLEDQMWTKLPTGVNQVSSKTSQSVRPVISETRQTNHSSQASQTNHPATHPTSH